MKSIAVKCPECNAALEVSAGTCEVRCTYCGTLAVIQRRTRFLQRPAPLPPRPAAAPEVRVAKQGFQLTGAMVAGLFTLVPILLAVGLPLILCSLDWSTPWGLAVLADIDGDGDDDLVAMMRDRENEAMYLAAFDGRSGKRRWRSDEIGRGTGLGTLCTAGDVVIEGNKGASLKGINLADGELRWQVRLGEAVEQLCAGEDAATVRVVRKDKQVQLLALADGTLRPAVASGTCGPLRCDRPFDRRGEDIEHRLHLNRRERKRWELALPGMQVEKMLRAGATTLVLGYKTPGTSVPLIASVRVQAAPTAAPKPRPGDFTGGHGEAAGPTVIWRAVVPAQNPLSAKGRAPALDQIALDGEVVAIVYELNNNSSYRLTVFSLADGRRRFDVALPEKLRGTWSVLITQGRVIVTSTWGVIAAYDVKSGEAAFIID